MTRAELFLHILSIKGVGSKTCGLLVDRLGPEIKSADELHSALLELGGTVPRFNPSEAALDAAFQKAGAIFEDASREGIHLLAFGDDDYPRSLMSSGSPPLLLYYMGAVSALDEPSCAIIGSRKAEEHSLRAAGRAAMVAAKEGLVVVSGLAMGVDAAAHRGCLDGSGVTVAVLAGGLDNIQPSSNRELANDILRHGGALVSEYPVGTRPIAANFVKRNRIQAGLSGGVLLIQAAERSGSMVTCEHALSDGRVLGVYRPPTGFGVAYEGNEILAGDERSVLISNADTLLQFCRSSNEKARSLSAPISGFGSTSGAQARFNF